MKCRIMNEHWSSSEYGILLQLSLFHSCNSPFLLLLWFCQCSSPPTTYHFCCSICLPQLPRHVCCFFIYTLTVVTSDYDSIVDLHFCAVDLGMEVRSSTLYVPVLLATDNYHFCCYVYLFCHGPIATDNLLLCMYVL